MRTKMDSRRCVRLGLAAFVAAVAMLATQSGLAEPDGIRLGEVQGAVEIGRGEPPVWSAAHSGDVLAPGDVVRAGRGGRAQLDLGTGTVRLYENSLVRVPADAWGPQGAEAVELERGNSLFDVIRERLSNEFEVRTPEVVVSVKGTRFGVSLESALAAVSVFRGAVGVRSFDAQLEDEVLVRAGFAAVGGLERAFELVVIPELDPWDSWSTGAGLPTRPDRLVGASAARAAIEQARELGRRAAKVELVQKVAEERPELVREALAARAEKMHEARLQEMRMEEMRERRQQFHELRGSLEPSDASLPASIDPVTDAWRLQKQTALEMEKEVIDTIIDGSMASGSSSITPPFSVQVVTSGGPNTVVISDATGVLTTIDQNQLDQILATEDPALLGNLLPILEALEIDPMLFAQKLDTLI